MNSGSDRLVVEILSPGTRRCDEGLKRRLYERMRVDEYWIVDPPPGEFELLALLAGPGL